LGATTTVGGGYTTGFGATTTVVPPGATTPVLTTVPLELTVLPCVPVTLVDVVTTPGATRVAVPECATVFPSDPVTVPEREHEEPAQLVDAE
jgi:hypothetical protein